MSAKVVALALLALVAVSVANPLDDYVALPDSSYHYEYVNSIRGASYTVYNLNVTSQTWLTAAEHGVTSVWTHWLQICVPDTIPRGNLIGLMYVDSGSNKAGLGPGTTPTSADSFTAPICAQANTIVANLGQVPNQPITFSDGVARSEDALVAYTWKQFMQNTTNHRIIATLPMTKAVVRGMDAVTHFLRNEKNIRVPKFVVSGASKRGWTAWTVAAVDDRVVGVVPIVMPMGNMTPLIDEMYRVYGTWSFALNDYVNAGVLEYLRTPQWNALLSIIDPKSYYSRWSGLPKYVIAAAGDEFFLPSSPRHFWADLPEPKMLHMVPNTDHSFIEYTPGVASGIVGFMQRLSRNLVLPRFQWKLTYSNTTATIRAWSTGFYQPQSVYLWHSTTLNPFQRDYRLLTCATTIACINPVAWTQERLNTFPGQTVWTASISAPAAGWTAFLLQAVYPAGYYDFVPAHDNPDPWIRISTEANIVPDRLPFGYCEDSGACQP